MNQSVKQNSHNQRWYAMIILFGVLGFISIVVYLHVVQIDYHPTEQLMSELALGQQGGLMLWAFMSFAVAVVSAIKLLAHPVIKSLLALAALSLANAGLFKLGDATTLHVALVALAFILLVLSMYLTPRLISSFQTPSSLIICWGFAIATALFVALGQSVLAIGLAQRLAAACILLWLSWLAVYNTA